MNIRYTVKSLISDTESQNLDVSRIFLHMPVPNPLSQVLSREWRCSWGSDALTTSNWSASALPTKMRLTLEAWRYDL